mmetsp:Transcript_54931/g.170151  ORF Transcript_54931/g.170151 Transcript_54931/m.170151 type:complete len:148 (-) Transcript_54931:28-471(-)
MRTKKQLFIRNKKPISRKMSEMPELLADMLLKERGLKAKQAKKRKEKAKPPGKLTKKERMRQELLGSLAGSFDEVADRLEPEQDREEQVYRQQASSFLMQAANRAKLKPTDEVTLTEFCDVVWRAGNPSPLDWDEPPRTAAEDAEEL